MPQMFSIPHRPDWRYKELALGYIPQWGWDLKNFKSPCLKDVAESFTWNLVRTSTFALMPAWIALEALREQLWLDHARVKDGQTLNPDLAAYLITPDSKNIDSEFARLAENYRKTPEPLIKQFIAEIAIPYIENGIPISRGIALGVEIIFESIIREAWTGFEELARELWATLLDNDDGSLAGRATRILQKPKKNIVPTFNVKTHPGSFQVEMRQVTFQKLGDIKTNYEAVFGSAATHLFDVEAPYIHILSAFRNILVHKRGKADRAFRNQVSKYSEFDCIKEDDQVAPDGEAVRKMRDAAMVLGRKLVEMADAELLRQATAKKPER